MIKKAVALVLLFLFFYGFFVARSLPASLVTTNAQTLDKNLALAGAEGTIWSGKASTLQYEKIDLGQLRWDVSPLSLLLLALSADVVVTDKAGIVRANVGVSPSGRLTVSDGTANLSVAAILEKADFDLIQAKGNLNVQIHSLKWDGQQLSDLEGEITWQKAEVTATSSLPLGSLTARFYNEGEQIVLEMIDGGHLRLAGKLVLQPNGQYSINGSISPPAELKADLGPILAYLGRPSARGQYKIKHSGRL